MELYTSLTRLKMTLNGGVMPPMTPLTGRAKKYIDPTFTPGMGALEEDVFNGLRCPLRGCGRYFHHLSRHLDMAHRNVGGAKAVRAALDIPKSVALNSSWDRALSADRIRTRMARGVFHRGPGWGGRGLQYQPPEARTHAAKRGWSTRRSVASRNLADRCIAQLTHRILDASHKIGRSPSLNEFEQVYGRSMAYLIVRVFGSWNAAKGHCGLSTYSRGGVPKWDLDGLLSAFNAYYQRHQHLPSERRLLQTRLPLLPAPATVCRVLKTKSWPKAMRQIAAALGITGGRYGLPTTKSAA